MAGVRRAGHVPLAKVAKSGPEPVYAIDGEERVLVHETVSFLKTQALPKTAQEFNFDSFSGKDTSMERVLDAARTLPAFAPRRLVLVQQADSMLSQGASAFLDYLNEPSPTTVLIVVAEKFDARTKLFRALQKKAVVLRYPRPRPREMPEAVKKRAGRMGLEIGPRAVHRLIECVGTDLSAASQALELLDLYVGQEKRAILVEDVEAVVSHSKEASVFALADAIGDQDLPGTLTLLHGILTVSREHPLRVLALIARHYRHLIQARVGLDSGLSRPKLQAELGLPPFLLDRVLSQARRHPARGLMAGLSAVVEADRSLKGGQLGGRHVMERLALRLVRAR